MTTARLGIVIQGAVSSSFKSSLQTTNFGILGIDKSIKQLSKTRFEVKAFQQLSKNAEENKDKLEILSRSLKKSGIDVSNLNQDSKRLNGSLAALKKVSTIDIKIKSVKNQFEQQKASILGIGAALYGLKKSSDVASDVFKAQGEIRSLDISKKGIDAITKAGHNMSLQFGQITAPEFIRASYDIKSGISSLSDEGVKDMTKMAATTAVATKASIADMTKLYALGFGIFRKDFADDMDFGKKFSGAIAMSVQAFRTDGADLAAGISNVGATAKAMGVSLEEELAIIGMSKEAFNSASEAGSGYRAFLSGVGKAQKELGLDFTDSNGKMLPMIEILEKIKDKYGDLDLEEIDSLSTAFGGQEATKIITALIPKIDELGRAQKNISQAMDEGTTKAEQMALAMDSGYGSDKMANAIKYVSFIFGKVLQPAINLAASALGGFALGVAWVDENMSWVIPIISTVTFGIVGLVAVLKIVALAKLGVALATSTLQRAFFMQMAQNYMSASSFNILNLRLKAYALWSKLATASQWLFNVALSANPIGLIITSIAVLIGFGVLLYKNFEPVRNLFNSIYETGIKLMNFIGFGDGEQTGGESQKNKPIGKLAATALTTTALDANPIATGEVKPNSSSVVNNTPTYNINVTNPKSDVDVVRAMKTHEQQQKNRSYEDD